MNVLVRRVPQALGLQPASTRSRDWDKASLVLAKLVLAVLLVAFLVLPLLAVLARAAWTEAQGFVGLAPLLAALRAPHFADLAWRSVVMAGSVTAIVLPLAYAFAFGLQRTRAPWPGVWRGLALLPLLAPSLLPGIALVYLFGNQGMLKSWFPSGIYGFWGIVWGEVFYTFPHALMVLLSALALADARLYDAARAMGAGSWRRFTTITLPSTRYGAFSAGCLVFTLAITDFGVPKVVGGSYHVLALEAYKAVVGQQNFAQGAAIGLLLLVPALLSFWVDAHLRRRQVAQMGARSVALVPRPHRWRDLGFACAMGTIGAGILMLIVVAVGASLVKLWPYNLEFTLNHYRFEQVDGGGWLAFRNSLVLSAATALVGTALVFTGAWLIERTRTAGALAGALHGFLRAASLLPMAVPGLVLGLGYVFFFNHPANPLHGLYGGMALLVASAVVHFYTTAHLSATASLQQLDGEFEAVSASLKVSAWRTYLRITLPVCLPTVLETARYLFVSAMTTVSAVIFLYSPDTVLASIAVLNMDDAGDIGPAAAMSTLILATSVLVSLLMRGCFARLLRRSQAWRLRQPVEAAGDLSTSSSKGPSTP